MDSRKDDPPSFDPRTWRGSFEDLAGAAAAKPEAASRGSPENSFDPKSWAGPADGPEIPADAPPLPQGNSRTLVAAVGAGAAILVAGAALFWFRQPSESAPAKVTSAAAPASAEPAEPGSSRRTLIVPEAGQLAAAIAGIGLDPGAAKAVSAQVAAAIGSMPGEIRLSYEVSGQSGALRLRALEATRPDGSGVAIAATAEGGLKAEKLAADVDTHIRPVTGQMDETNFYSSAVTAGMDDSLISDFAKALAFDFTFQTEIKAGDVFGAAIEQATNAAGQPVGLPRLLFVSMRTSTKVRALYSFVAPGDTQPSWFDANGRSASRALMRTPVDGARISSRFGARFHPVLHFVKMHRGIDFAAPTGTPIYASGSGVVTWAAMKGANGNMTAIQHDNGWRTLYLHQSMFMPGTVPGARVSQGQKIGEVGTTGRSTGPHLHYEVHIDGQAVDPQSIDTGTGTALEGAALARFKAERDRIDRARAGAR